MRRSTLAMGTVIAASLATLLGPVSTAHAGPNCTLGFCSHTSNDSNLSVYIAKNWCWSTGTTGSATTSDPYCSSSSERMWISPGQDSPSGQDWDTFRVDAGWCYSVKFTEAEWYGLHEWWVTYNRVGQSTPFWVKVENNAIASVRAQRYGSCP
ncbi:hypothetical protein [Streptomyces chiangmaiensis]|uniref:Secreted protein n=1 Tax=Streptomyces chiangmaiensis TaxID=766497 RepID=A0ABU7FT17_9ACTN|nr:hypothetical protein [Streptomyces chiangmaiensis]MED7827255.1 hypothetical protein [Streptomyces chiangmaiensis]